MANVLSRVQEGIDLFRRAQEVFEGVTSTIADGREAVDAKRLDQLEEMLKREKLETQAAADGLAAAIKDYRAKRR